MATERARVGDRRPGGRSARVRNAVLDATIEALTERDVDVVSIDDIATRAGVHKTTVYRRWPTKELLIAEASRRRSDEAVPVPDTGSLAGDLRALAREVTANLTSEPGARLTRHLVTAAAASEEVAAEMHRFWADRLGAMGVMVERAVGRGEVHPDTDPGLVIETLIGPIWVRMLLTGEPLDAPFADRVARLVAEGTGASAPPMPVRRRGRKAPERG